MEEAVVSFLLQNVKELLLTQAHLIKNAKNQVEFLERDLQLLKDFVVNSTQDSSLKMILGQIRDIIFEAEDTIDSFLTLATEKQRQNFLAKMCLAPVKTLGIANEVERIRGEINHIYSRDRVKFAKLRGIETETEKKTEKKEELPMMQEIIVGFDDEAEKLINLLTEESEELDVISIIGVPGIGKSTLARKIFNDPTIEDKFVIRKWVDVSKDYLKKDMFLSIVSHFTQINDELTDDDQIALTLGQYLERETLLIVLDDVCTDQVCFDLRAAFQKSNKNRCKILITSRNEQVAKQASRHRHIHELRHLTHEESWRLFQLKVFGMYSVCPSELEELGKLIVVQCGRLPRSIVAIAGILVKTASSREMRTRKTEWRKVRDRVKLYLEDNPENNTGNITTLDYNKLPHHLRPCFLYLGMFPENFDIPVKRLILLWIAEGFVQKKTGLSWEETGQEYLEELINMNLVTCYKRSLDGSVKICRIHAILREFCKSEGGNDKEKLFHEMNMSDEGTFQRLVSDVQNYRRICIHSNISKFVSSKPFGERVRSFLCFSREQIYLPSKDISSILAALKLVRVLDVRSIRIIEFPDDLAHLVHLRYIAMSSDFKILPKSISKLWNLQTLIVDTTSRTLEINADFWNMINLRHLKTNASATLPKPPKNKGSSNKDLQTLGTISTESCTEEVFTQAKNLRKLGIRGPIHTISWGKGLEKMDNLEKLKLVNDVLFGSPSEAKLSSLPQQSYFPTNLRRLTLSATYLDWKHMSTLGKLYGLEVLKLKENAFVGQSWVSAVGDFCDLKVLHIEGTDLILWAALEPHFPRLGHLILKNCEKLEEIPIALHKTLNVLELENCKLLAICAREIQRGRQETARSDDFKLIIAPGDG